MAKKTPTALGRDWTQGSIFRNLLSISWPLTINSALTGIGPIVDMVWVGKLGAASVAGVGVAALLVALLDAFKMGLDMGTRAMIARFTGAGDKHGANHAALQGYVVTIGFAAIVGTLGAIFAGPILRLMGLAPDVVTQGAPYMRIQFIGILTQGLVRQNEGTMQFSGDAINPMKIAIVYRIFHVVLSPFLIFGWWIFPQLGTSGAALTSVISACLGAGIGLWFLLTGHTRLKLDFRGFRPDGNMIWRIIKIGVPASITGIGRNLGQVTLTWFIVPFGTVPTAAHALVQQITQLVNIGGAGLAQGSSVLTGQSLGAKQPERAAKSAWLGVGLFTCIMTVASVIVWFWGPNVIAIFNNQPDVLLVGHTFLRIQIVTLMMWGFVVVMQNCLNGIGDTMTTMFVVLVSIFLAQIPAAYLLSRHTGLGVYGTYWAIAISTFVMASCYVAYFQTGRWKRKRL